MESGGLHKLTEGARVSEEYGEDMYAETCVVIGMRRVYATVRMQMPKK